jgi:GTPase SAR1 family protein
MKSKKKLIAVIGNAHAGKSSIIQSLTGCENRMFRGRVTDRDTRKWVNVIASSPKEDSITRQKLVAMMRAAAMGKRSLGLVIALQPHKIKASVRLTIEDVFKISSRYEFDRHVFVISKPYNKRASGIDIAKIQKLLGKSEIEVPIQPLNARRFAHINASLIRDVVGWF